MGFDLIYFEHVNKTIIGKRDKKKRKKKLKEKQKQLIKTARSAHNKRKQTPDRKVVGRSTTLSEPTPGLKQGGCKMVADCSY